MHWSLLGRDSRILNVNVNIKGVLALDNPYLLLEGSLDNNMNTKCTPAENVSIYLLGPLKVLFNTNEWAVYVMHNDN